MLKVLYVNFRSSILRGWGVYIYILNNFNHIQNDMEACSSYVASRSTFIASCWRNHKPFHTAHTSNLTLGTRSGHTLWVTERENVFNQSGFTKAQFNTLTRRLSHCVTFVDTQMHSNEKIPVCRSHECILHRLSGVNSHKFTEKAESACWENAVALLHNRRWDLQREIELLAR